MGRMIYDSTTEADFDDRLLAHLQIVIGTKFGKGESFYFSWRDAGAAGDGRTSLWLHPAIPLRFKYFGGRAPSINPEWVRRLLMDSYSAQGLRISPEPEHAVHTAAIPTV
ncbi:ATP-dependent DNA ligase [Rathayibacter caricis DSM 15933]|uniref:ATP-dependent DNA ligase n=1 Tax=Rathayibacter caricis DSM 15933 TaxID=1328867 RepID=A0A2T4USL8_9MICO|nr:ATP-dependent DNA ligase [Rathayibacter caricis]MCJ1695975.1 ATP-dependent DNA ligase [Rathayibacter caricis]PTL72517.1 ATP-dependent DNA ligase [Rathayibacter caricis DSM 15933]